MGKDPEDFLFYRQSIIANAKALYGPHRTYDVIGSPAIKVALIAYSASSSGSTQGEIVRVADGVVSGVSMKKLHEDMAREVVMKLRGLRPGAVFVRTEGEAVGAAGGTDAASASASASTEWDDARTLRNE